MREMSVIRNHGHEMYSEKVNKFALSANDDKRIIREDGIHTYAYGHYATLSSEDPSLSPALSKYLTFTNGGSLISLNPTGLL